MAHATSYSQLRSLPTEELVRVYDSTAKSTELGLAFIREEIARRENAEQTEAISRMTRQMRDLTRWITGLTIINVLLAGITIFK